MLLFPLGSSFFVTVFFVGDLVVFVAFAAVRLTGLPFSFFACFVREAVVWVTVARARETAFLTPDLIDLATASFCFLLAREDDTSSASPDLRLVPAVLPFVRLLADFFGFSTFCSFAR